MDKITIAIPENKIAYDDVTLLDLKEDPTKHDYHELQEALHDTHELHALIKVFNAFKHSHTLVEITPVDVDTLFQDLIS